MARFLIADHQDLCRRGLMVVLAEGLDGFTFQAADTLESARHSLSAVHFDLAAIDLSLPGLHSATELGELRLAFPSTRFVALSAQPSRESVISALASGFSGYIPSRSLRVTSSQLWTTS